MNKVVHMKRILMFALLLNCMLLSAQNRTFIAYNDCVYTSGNQYKADNVTTFGIGNDFTGQTSGHLVDFESGNELNVRVMMNSSGSVGWSPAETGGRDCATGTDAYEMFHDIADMIGVIVYGDTGWWVEATFIGLDPEKTYTFATSASRDAYTDRYTIYTLRGADSCKNESSVGAQVLSENKVMFNTGGNHVEGYIAKWAKIRAMDGTFTVRAESFSGSPEGRKAYGFSLFMLEETAGNRSPNQPQVISPASGSVLGDTSARLTVNSSDPDGDFTDIGFFGRKIPAASDTFSIVVLPDVQNYSQFYPDVFKSQTQWIKNNRDANHIVFVTQEGDIVNNSGSEAEWQNARSAMGILDGVVPYGLAPGNHDKPTELYNTYFPFSAYEQNSWYGGHYPANTNDNNYQLFSGGGVGFIILHLEFAPGYDVIAWADSVLKAYPDRKAIITTHAFIDGNGNRNGLHIIDSSEYIWLNLVEPNPNVYFVLCGHVHTEKRRVDRANGHAVYQLLADYQNDPNGGNGWLRIMEFSPKNNSVKVRTFSPWLNQFRTGSDSEFDLDFTMSPYSEIGRIRGVESGKSVSLQWQGLVPGSEYEWFTSSSDRELTSTGNKSRFKISLPAWTAYNDCVYTPVNQYKPANVTTYGIGAEYDGATSGNLVDFSSGRDTGVKVLITRKGTVHWQTGSLTGGRDCATGTDAYTMFGGKTDMTGVVYYDYDDTDWWVELTFIGLEPGKKYAFATSASRNHYDDRNTMFTIKGAGTAGNASTTGVKVKSSDSVVFNTGGNHNEGFVARWNNITTTTGSFTVRAEPSSDSPQGRKAYAFSVFMLQEMVE
jgi:hypothetical protein